MKDRLLTIALSLAVGLILGGLTDHHFTAEAVNTWSLQTGKAATVRVTGPASLEELPSGGLRIRSAWPLEVGDVPVAAVGSGS